MNSTVADVWENSKVSGTELLALMAIAEKVHNGSRTAVATIKEIASIGRMSVTAAKHCISRLIESGEIESFRQNDDGTCSYIIAMFQPSKKKHLQQQKKNLRQDEQPCAGAGPARMGSMPDGFELEPEIVSPTVVTWNAYREAYLVRYKVEPVRNVKVNSQIKQLIHRIGKDAPAVAAFYVYHNNFRYVGQAHSVGILLMDAEKLRTEWAMGRRITNTEAQQADRKQANLNAVDEVLRRRQERGS